MTFALHVDVERWQRHTEQVARAVPGIVPVAKGNGYGFGITMLAEQSSRLGLDTVAVGSSDEVAEAQNGFEGDVLVLSPWHPVVDPMPSLDPRTVLTVSHPEALRALAGSSQRIVVEVFTSMRRHGLDADALQHIVPLLDDLAVEGFALHLPLDEGDEPRTEEVSAHLALLARLGLTVPSLWVSHLGDDDLATLHRRHPGVVFRPRIGTRLWLGDRESYRARATVLDVHPLRRGQRFGYRQRKALHDGHLLIVRGGTSHGVGLTAPRPVSGAVTRAKAAALGGMEAAGRVLSPFRFGGRRRFFAEPPHMQVSMMLLPADVVPPTIGDELDVDVRMTTTLFDAVVLR